MCNVHTDSETSSEEEGTEKTENNMNGTNESK
jgi:hypothetical protein